jgi:hypothetical protein
MAKYGAFGRVKLFGEGLKHAFNHRPRGRGSMEVR